MEKPQFVIQNFTIQNQQQSFEAEIRDADDNIITFFGAARIQNVRPLVYNEQFDRYEAE